MNLSNKPQPRRTYGYEQDYPGSCRWKLEEVKCPRCGKWVREYGDVSVNIDGHEHYYCLPCGDAVWASDE